MLLFRKTDFVVPPAYQPCMKARASFHLGLKIYFFTFLINLFQNCNLQKCAIALCFLELDWGRVSPAELVSSSVLDCNRNRARTICQPKPQGDLDATFQDTASTCINKKLLLKSPFISSVNEVEFKGHGVSWVFSGCTDVLGQSARACPCYLCLQSCPPLFHVPWTHLSRGTRCSISQLLC